MGHMLSAKTVKFASLENLFEYGIWSHTSLAFHKISELRLNLLKSLKVISCLFVIHSQLYLLHLLHMSVLYGNMCSIITALCIFGKVFPPNTWVRWSCPANICTIRYLCIWYRHVNSKEIQDHEAWSYTS